MPASLNLKPGEDQSHCVQSVSKLCYDQPMTIWRRILTAAMPLILLSSPAWSQSSGDRLAEDLNNLRVQQHQLEEHIEQYQMSIELLRKNISRGDGSSPALETLKAQLTDSQTSLVELFEKEAALEQQLISDGKAGPDRNSDAADVARLKALLNNYYTAEALAAGSAGADATGGNLTAAHGYYPLDKVHLSGREGISAIQYMDRRLTEDYLTSPRRQADIIFHIEVQRDGELVSSSSHSLRSLGRSFYVTKVSLQGGTAKVSIRRDQWVARLSADTDSFYLVTLYLPLEAAPELHIIPVDELKETGWRELPPWLPPIGALPPAPTPS